MIGSLAEDYIEGFYSTATLTNTNVHANQAEIVCLLP